MKALLSYVLMLAPICVVFFLTQKQWDKQRLKCWGLAGMASSLCTWIGARYFGLYALGRASTLEGSMAEGGAKTLFVLSTAMVALHYLIQGIKRVRRPRAPKLP